MKETVLETFRDRFRALVDEQEISKTECAKRIGISYKTFRDMYNYGKSKPIRILKRIVLYFNVSADYLLGLSDEKHRKGAR